MLTVLVSTVSIGQDAGAEPAEGETTESTEEKTPTASGDAALGKELFYSNCKTCHDPTLQKPMAGPALKGVFDRVPNEEWLYGWIRNSSKLIKSGDEYANKVYNENGKSPMSSFENFSDEDITNILAWIKAGGTKVEPKNNTASANGAGGGDTEGGSSILVLSIVLVALVLVVAVLILMSTSLNKQLNDKEDLDDESKRIVNERHNPVSILKHPAFIGIIVVLLLAGGLVALVKKGAYGIGVQTGYAPVQPIPYSHKLHAGDLKIDCNYCHTGARKAKNANIPSANICMNCHKNVKAEKNDDGTLKNKNIAKIWASLGYNPKTQEFEKEKEKPIQWNRVHNLPDLSYFNHAQHAGVAGIECQECHGPIETMEVVRQHSTLTMGWCIDCHRKTPLNLEEYEAGTGYYDKELIKKLVRHNNKKVSDREWKKIEEYELSDFEQMKDALKVQDIGGLECSKCHY